MKNITDFNSPSASQLVSDLANKKMSAVELMQETIARIEKFDKEINAVVVRDFERALLAAKTADAALARGERLPLLGLPMTVKESFNVEGLTTHWGNILYKNCQSAEDALAVTRLKAAGAIIIGKTNVPFMLGDWQTYNDIYGTTNNPWNLAHTPGGSSGGSAAALAAGFVTLELGSDLAGSLRTPAHYCGVYAHKPTQDLVPMRGGGPPMLPSTPTRIDLAVSGPMARCAADLALELAIIAGPDETMDGKGYKLSLPPARHEELKNFRVLVIDNHPLYPTEKTIVQALDNFAKNLQKLGVTVSHNLKNLPDLAETTRVYAAQLGAFYSGNTPLTEYQNLQLAVEKIEENDRSLLACFLRGLTGKQRDWMIDVRTRNQLRQLWRNVFKDYDVILCPVMPTVAPLHDHTDMNTRQIKVDEVMMPYNQQYTWAALATLCGLPATVMPIAMNENKLPIGMQIIGDYFEDYTTIKFAELVDKNYRPKSTL